MSGLNGHWPATELCYDRLLHAPGPCACFAGSYYDEDEDEAATHSSSSDSGPPEPSDDEIPNLTGGHMHTNTARLKNRAYNTHLRSTSNAVLVG